MTDTNPDYTTTVELDTDIAPAPAAEAHDEDTVEITWRDQTYLIPVADAWAVEASIAFEEGHAALAVRAILGPEQWDRFMATKPKNRDLNELFDVAARAIGLRGAGE